MNRFIQTTGLIATFLGNASSMPVRALDAPSMTMEIRLAESKPGPGLTEAIVTGSDRKVYLHKEVALTQADITSARAKEAAGQEPGIDIRLTAAGAQKISRLTERHLNKPLAILVNGEVVSAPIIRTKISGKSIMLSGNFTKEEAERIAKSLAAK